MITEKHSLQITLLNSKIQSKENENLQLRKEIEELNKQLKSSNLTINNNDFKFLRVNEDRDKLKATIKTLKDELKDIKDIQKKRTDEMNLIVKQIEKHRNELIVGFKKQLQLIDNLKRQKVCVRFVG